MTTLSLLLRVRRGFALASLAQLLSLTILLAFCVPSDAWSQTYHGRVVDSETGEPLSGAVIAVIWYKKPVIRMNGPIYFHNATETLTDAEGKFSLDASPGINWNPLTVVQAPEMVIFRPEYRPLTPSFPGEFRDVYGIADALERGTEIKLTKLKTKEDLMKFTALSSFGIIQVPAKAIPNLIRLVNVQGKMAGLTSFYSEPHEKGVKP